MKNTVVVFILFLSSSLSIAQESIDLITLSGRYGVPSQYKETYNGKATEIATMLNVKLPVVINETTIWYNELIYTYFFIDNDEVMPVGIANPLQLHGFVLQTGLVKKLNNNNAFQLLLVPRFMTDFENANKQNWQVGGIALYEKRYHNNLMMRFGLLYNQEQFGPLLVPLVHLDWKIGNKCSIVGMLPIFLKVNYFVTDNTIIGFSHFGLTTSYRLGNVNYANDYIERTSIDLSLFVRQRIAGNIHIEARLGQTLNRKYAQYSEDDKIDMRIMIFNLGDNRTQKNVNFKDGIIGNIRLVYNLPLGD